MGFSMNNIWLIAGGIVLAIVVVMILVNVILLRSADLDDKRNPASDRGRRKSSKRRLPEESQPTEESMRTSLAKSSQTSSRIGTETAQAAVSESFETPLRPTRVTSELELMSDLLNEIEAGKGQEPDSAEEVDFAAVHTSFIKPKPQETGTVEKHHETKQPAVIQEWVREWIREEERNPHSMGWLILKGDAVFQTSDEFERETEEVFLEWKRLVDQTEKALALTGLSNLQLSGVEGQILVKRKQDYMLFALRDGD